MPQGKSNELAVVLIKPVRENASINRIIQAKRKVIVNSLLRQYGHSPDMQLLTTKTVLKQAELIPDRSREQSQTIGIFDKLPKVNIRYR